VVSIELAIKDGRIRIKLKLPFVATPLEGLSMISSHTTQVAERAKAIYRERLMGDLEAAHMDGYVAIEPESGEHFVADSFGEAVAAARTAHPDRISFVIHIGHGAAIHVGGWTNSIS
jgi:hypothetical protein